MPRTTRTIVLASLTMLFAVGMTVAATPEEPEYLNPIYLDVADKAKVSLADALAGCNAANGTSYSVQGLDGGDFKDCTIVKRGNGELRMNVAMTNFMGAIHVEEGVLTATNHYALGAGNSGAPESGTFVHDGATLYMGSDASTINPVEGECITIEGYGNSATYGAIRVENADKNAFWGLGRNLALSDDARIVYGAHPTTTRRLGFKGYGDYPQMMDMNGRTLTLQGNYNREQPYFTFWGVTGNSEEVPQFMTDPGHIIATNLTLMMQYDMILAGDASNMFTLRYVDFGLMTERNTYAPWSIDVRENSAFMGGECSLGRLSCVTNVGQWNGPIILSSDAGLKRWTSSNEHFSHISFKGKVSGPGGFRPAGGIGTRDKVALHLLNPENDFAGGIVMTNGVIYAGENGVIPPNGGMVVLTNSVLHLCGKLEGTYTLPSLELNGRSSVVGGNGRWTGCVSKTGEGAAKYSSSVGGPLLDVTEGELCFPKFRTGLYTGQYTYGPNTQARQKMLTTTHTNRIVCAPEMAYAMSESGCWSASNTLYSYSGTIWNREEDADWTFAASVIHAYVELDGKEVLRAYPSNWSQRYATNRTVRVTKGAHRMVVSVASIKYPGDMANDMLNVYNNTWTWNDKSGIMLDRQGRGSKNVADYERLEDPGDGSLFTLSSEQDDSWLPAFDRVNVDEGAVLNLDGHAYSAQDISGGGTVTGGDVTVNGAFIADSRSVAGGGTLAFGGRLAFAEGAKFKAAVDRAEVPQSIRENGWLAAYAEGGIEGLPEVDESSRRNWRVFKTDDGRGLMVSYYGRFAVIVR